MATKTERTLLLQIAGLKAELAHRNHRHGSALETAIVLSIIIGLAAGMVIGALIMEQTKGKEITDLQDAICKEHYGEDYSLNRATTSKNNILCKAPEELTTIDDTGIKIGHG